MKKIIKEKGITLIALVITIIILVIITSVIVATITTNSLMDKAKEASRVYTNSQQEEKELLENNELIFISTRENNDTNPAGTIIAYMGATAPNGYLPCDGAKKSVSEYSALYNVLKDIDHTGWTEADWTTEFSLPDLRGEFLRGTGTNATSGHSGANVGLHQKGSDVIGGYFGSSSGCIYVGEAMFHSDMYNKADNWIGNSGLSYNYGNVSRRSENSTYNSTIGKGTTRPTNTSILYCIKY